VSYRPLLHSVKKRLVAYNWQQDSVWCVTDAAVTSIVRG